MLWKDPLPMIVLPGPGLSFQGINYPETRREQIQGKKLIAPQITK
jgi:hypothetical protein